MPVFKLHSTSFTIEGSEGESPSSIMKQAGLILYEWTKMKEIRLRHFTESKIPQTFPKPEQFLKRSSYAFHEQNSTPASLFDSVSGVLSDQRFAQGFRYKHEDQENQGTVTLEAVFVSTADNAVICSSSLFFEGDRLPGYNTPPGYLLSLWRLGSRTYNTKSCSPRCRDIIQLGLSHIGETEDIQCVEHGLLSSFLADRERKIISVSIPERDFTESNPKAKSIIRTIAGHLIGSVEFFFLPGSYAQVLVHEPGKVYTQGRRILFSQVNWSRLENELRKQSRKLGLPPVEDGAIPFSDLSKSLEPVSSATSAAESSPDSLPKRDYISNDESGPRPNLETMSSFADRLKMTISELVTKLDSWNATTENEP